MKKSIISLILLMSFSVQSTYPLFEGLKKKFAGSEKIQQAKELLNMKANIRCMRLGDNCSKEKRKMLIIISGLITALMAAGVAVAGKAIVSKVGEANTPQNIKERFFQFVRSNDFINAEGAIKDLIDLAQQNSVNLNDIRKDGMSLIGVYLQGRKQLNAPVNTVIVDSLNEVAKIKPTAKDKETAKEMGLGKIGKVKL